MICQPAFLILTLCFPAEPDHSGNVANFVYNFSPEENGSPYIRPEGKGLAELARQRGKFTQWRQGKSRAEIRKVYEQYVQNLTDRYFGRVLFYDVINEHAGFKASYRGDPYYNTTVAHNQFTDLNMFGHLQSYTHPGEGEVYALEYYIRTLGIANCMDPDARLVYLDYNNEIIGSKANVMYRKLVEVFLEFPNYNAFFIAANSAFYAVQDAFEHYCPGAIATVDFGEQENGFSSPVVLNGASVSTDVKYRENNSLRFSSPGDEAVFHLDLGAGYFPHLSYYWYLEDLPYDRPFTSKLGTRFMKELLAVEVSTDGTTWNRIRTYDETLLRLKGFKR